MRIHIAAFAMGVLLPLSCFAADDGELWEITTQMNIPGMPAGMAGMGQAPQRVCTGKDPKEDATRRPDMQKCKVVDMKQTATRLTLTMNCPEGQAVIDQTYNAARTEYKGTMTMKSRDGDMVMNTSGRKVGSCDVQQARKARDDKMAKMKAQGDAQMAAVNRQQADARKQSTAEASKACTEAASGMDMSKFPLCYQAEGAKNAACTDKQAREFILPKEAQAVCDAKKAEFCQKLQTEAGFDRVAKGHRSGSDDEEQKARPAELVKGASRFCGLAPEKVVSGACSRAVKAESDPFLKAYCPAELKPYLAAKCARSVKEERLEYIGTSCPAEGKQLGASMCPKALKTEAYTYVGAYCPAEARALFKNECAGRDFTALAGKDPKRSRMCSAIAQGMQSPEERKSAERAEQRRSQAATQAPAEAKKASTTERVQQGFGKGLDKLKGLFGR